MLEVTNGHFCHSDVNIVAALTTPNFVIRGDEVDPTHKLEAIELAFSYVKFVPKKKGRRGSWRRDMPGVMREYEAGGELTPVVMFALKPVKGSFGLHKYKLKLWHRGCLFADTRFYASRHRSLIEEVKKKRAEAERDMELELEEVRRGASFELRPKKTEEEKQADERRRKKELARVRAHHRGEPTPTDSGA